MLVIRICQTCEHSVHGLCSIRADGQECENNSAWEPIKGNEEKENRWCSNCGHNNNDNCYKMNECNGSHSQWKPVKTPDPVNSPEHYTSGGIECIEAIRAALTADEFRGFIKGNIIKYAWREKIKNGDEDLKKIVKYIELLFRGEKNETYKEKSKRIVSC